MLDGLVSGAGPTQQAIEQGARRRAPARPSGMTLPDVIEACHIAYREIWNELLTDARQARPSRERALASMVSLLWLWFHRLTAAVAEGHAAQTQARRSLRLDRERELIDQLTGRVPVDEAIAAELGYQAGQTFTVVRAAGLGWRDVAERLAESLRTASSPVTCAYHEGHVVLVAQGLTPERACAAIEAIAPAARIGVGTRGAAISLNDARDAVQRASEDRRVVYFEQDWLMCTLNAVRPRFEAILEPARAVARRHPDLAETVRAYSRCQYSVSACARQLHIHPNSARYRLDDGEGPHRV